MRFHRVAWVAALFVAPAAVLFTAAPARADRAGPSTILGQGPLPRGFARDARGRTLRDICDHDAPFHCLSKEVVPEGARLEDYVAPLAPEVGPFADAGGGTFGGAFCKGNGSGGGKSPAAGSLGPGKITMAYDIPNSVKGNGRIVALIDMPDSHTYADLKAYRAAFGLGTLPQCTGTGLPLGEGHPACFAQVDATGSPSTTYDCPRADPETALDVEMVSAACPDCSILLVQMTTAKNGPFDSDFVKANKMATALKASAISISFGGAESGGNPTGYTTAGHLVLAASGDNGYMSQGSASYPASSPDVVAVGGTLLKSVTGGFAEVAWNDMNGATGSGCSTLFAMPKYQTDYGAAFFDSCKKRASVDISAAADYIGMTGFGAINIYTGGGWTQVVGTSAATPMVAGMLTILGMTDAISKDFGLLYKNEGLLNDVTQGSNLGARRRPAATTTAPPAPAGTAPRAWAPSTARS